MSIDLLDLGKRLRQARENCGITQQQAADALGVPRTAIVHIEAGKRVISTLELSELAQLYCRPIAEFLAESPMPQSAEEDLVTFHLRVADAFREAPEMKCHVKHWLEVCQEGAELESLLGNSRREGLPAYQVPEPKSISEAYEQGESVAEQERKRLGLGDAPVHVLPDLLSNVGIWSAGVTLPNEMSGMCLFNHLIGTVILVNNEHPRPRKRFSYAHEFAHALLDRNRKAMVSTRQNATDRTEKRANAFAAAFLMPESGVRSYLLSLDKGGASRQIHSVYAITGGEDAMERAAPGSQKIVYQDVALLARYYGVSYVAAVYRLRDLNIVSPDERQALIDQEPLANSYLKLLAFTKSIDSEDSVDHRREEETHELVSQVVHRAIEAYRRDEISAGRLFDLSKKLNISGPQLVDLAKAAV